MEVCGITLLFKPYSGAGKLLPALYGVSIDYDDGIIEEGTTHVV